MTDTTLQSGAAENPAPKSTTRWIPTIVRILLGLMFLVFGLNGFLNFMPAPKDMPADIMSVMGGLMKGGFFTVVSAAEIIVAVMLLTNRFVPLALALLAPIVVGIITFHIALAPKSIAPGIVVLLMELYLAWSYRHTFRPMLAMRARPV